MHIPDGFIDAKTSLAAGALAATALGMGVRRVTNRLDDREIPLAGLAAAFVFAAQMLNFPVAAGTSGHLLGGVLAAVLLGPVTGALCVTVVLVVQALVFADGGLSALGLNVMNMAVIGSFGGYALFALVRRAGPARRRWLLTAVAVAAALSPVMAAAAFTVEYAIGGNDAASLDTVAAAMVGVHLLIGIGEAVITTMTVSAVLAVRPDLVHGARALRAAGVELAAARGTR